MKTNLGNPLRLPEGRLSNFLQLNQPGERLLNAQIDRNKWFSLRCKTREIANRLQASPVYGLAGCRTSLIAHQLYIAHEVSRRYAPRVLLADEVGLGKTIEAGLILHQQLLLERAQRVLIVVPESLVHQWLVEMLRRFNLMFSIYDEARLADDAHDEAEYDDAENPFHADQLVLCSLEFLSSTAACRACAATVNGTCWWSTRRTTCSGRRISPARNTSLVESLAEQTAGLLLLTATPEQLGKESHFARLRLLDPDRFSDLDQFRAGRSGLSCSSPTRPKRCSTIPNAPTKSMICSTATAPAACCFAIPGTWSRAFREREVHPAALAADSEGDPYRPWLGELLREKRDRKVLVITASADTAQQLVEQMKSQYGIRAALFHEGMSLVERDRAAAWFAEREDGAQVLICSEIGSEGRNFQFAHHLVLFDLPLNPDLLEQRIGRLDRIGQNAVINIHVPYVAAAHARSCSAGITRAWALLRIPVRRGTRYT